MNKFADKLENARARLLDANATLHFLKDRENLNSVLETGCPDVVLGALIDQVDNLVSDACEDCELMQKTHNDDFMAELRASVAEARDYAVQCEERKAPVKKVADSVSRDCLQHVDKIDEVHNQTQSMLSMLMLYLSQAREGGETFNESVLESYTWQLVSNIERGQAASKALSESLRKEAAQ